MSKLKKFDKILAILLVLLVLVVGMKFVNFKEIGPGGEGLTYKTARVDYIVSGVRDLTVDAVKVGEDLYSVETDHKIGKIVDIQVKPYETNMKLLDGSWVKRAMPDRYTMVITVEAEISQGNTGYLANGITEIKVNSDAAIYTKYVWTNGVVGGIEFED